MVMQWIWSETMVCFNDAFGPRRLREKVFG